MKPSRKFWERRLQTVKRAWCALRPEDSCHQDDSGEVGLVLDYVRTLAHGMTFRASILGWRDQDESWSISVRGILDDHRVVALTSFVEERDSGRCPITFDVFAAHSVIEGREILALPRISFDAKDDEVREHVEAYSYKIDGIWSYFGGYNSKSFERLALWAMVHRDRIQGGPFGIAMACAAFVYGDRALCLQLFADIQAHWEARALAWGSDPQTEEDFAIIKENIAKLRAIVEQNQQWRH